MSLPATKSIPLLEAMQNLAVILAHIDENEGEVPDELFPVMEGGIEDVRSAVDRRIGLLRATKSAREMLKAERDRLKTIDARLERVEETVKETTRTYMEAFGSAKLEGNAGRFQIQKSGGLQGVTLHFNTRDLYDVLSDETARLVPREYVREVTVTVVDRKRLLEDVRNGIFLAPTEADPDGAVGSTYATLLPRTSSLRIY